MPASFLRSVTFGLVLLVPGTLLSRGHDTGAAPPEPHGFLRTIGKFSTTDVAALDRGEPIARILDTDKRQIAIVGAVRIRAPRERLLDRYRDVSYLKNSAAILQLGLFSSPPQVGDLQGLTFEDYDLQTIKACRPGDCGVRLPQEGMDQLGHMVDWQAGNWPQQAEAAWRRILVRYTSDYLTTGALAEYHNKADPLSVAHEFDVLFEDSQYFAAAAPEFFAYLKQYPRARLTGTADVLYWAKDTMGVRPVTSITHMAIYNPGGAPRPPAFVATKQIWATHYFDAGLGLTIAFDDNASGFYMLMVNRVRTRSLTSMMRALVRSQVQRKSRDAMESVLRSTKTILEAPR